MRCCFRTVLSIEIAALCMANTKCVALVFHRQRSWQVPAYCGAGKFRYSFNCSGPSSRPRCSVKQTPNHLSRLLFWVFLWWLPVLEMTRWTSVESPENVSDVGTLSSFGPDGTSDWLDSSWSKSLGNSYLALLNSGLLSHFNSWCRVTNRS